MIKILLVEDDLDDVELLEDTLTANNVVYELKTINDGDSAVEHVKTCTDCPDLIILDFNLPKVHGREIIKEIKKVQLFKDIPLLILTTSSAKEDIAYAYDNGADKYLVKPTNIEEIKNMLQVILLLAGNK